MTEQHFSFTYVRTPHPSFNEVARVVTTISPALDLFAGLVLREYYWLTSPPPLRARDSIHVVCVELER